MGVGTVMKEGKLVITAAQASAGIDVECGFIPAYIKAFNENGTVGENTVLERWRGMPGGTSLATIIIADNGTTSDENLVLETTNGLGEFDEGDVGQVTSALTGSNFAKEENLVLLTGTGSAFLTEVNVGDRVEVGEELLEVASIASDLLLNTTSPWGTTKSDATLAFVVVPGAEVSQSGFKGFTIPAAFIETDDVVWFVAWGTQFDEV